MPDAGLATLIGTMFIVSMPYFLALSPIYIFMYFVINRLNIMIKLLEETNGCEETEG